MTHFLVALTCLAPTVLEQEPPPEASLRFTLTECGLTFRHQNGASGRRYIVETMGAGVGLFDFDGDGDLDVYFVNGAPLPGSAAEVATNRLFRNRGAGTFDEVPRANGADDTGYGMGCAVGDIDNDGDPDLYVTNFGANRLYRNHDGCFEDSTRHAEVGDPAWSASAAFADFDGDGFLDLYVTNYLAFTLAKHRECSLGRGIPSYCSPDAYPGVADTLYRNAGEGRFRDVTARAGVGDAAGKGLGVLCGDFDADGRIDIYVANDGVANRLYRNHGDGRFEDVTLIAGVGFNDEGMAQAGMGIAGGDLDGDGWSDLFVTNLSSEANVLYGGGPRALFNDRTVGAGLGGASIVYTGFGTVSGDFDRDGDLDLFVANGHIIDNIREFFDYYRYEQPDQFFRNDGARFRDVTDGVLTNPPPSAGVGRGAALGDLDGDGDLDLVVTNSGGTPFVYRNDTAASGWLGLDLVGTRSNRDAVGGRVEISAGGRRQVRERYGGGSYLSHSDSRIHFGLGRARRVERVSIYWPSGTVQHLRDVAADQVLRVVEPNE